MPRAVGLTVANFGLVLGGLVVIARFGNDRLDTGLVNVWSIWGIAHVSVGQSLQVLAALPGNNGASASARTSRRRLVFGIVVLAAIAVVAFRARLFPDLGWSWPLAAIFGVASASVSGLLRGGLVKQRRAVLSLAVVCAENFARTALLLLVLGVDLADPLVPWAIVAPFFVSLPALVWFLRNETNSLEAHPVQDSPDVDAPTATTGRAALTMIPSLASYALLPLLSVFDRLPQTIEVDALAFDAALARGPVQVAVFAAPMALQSMLEQASGVRRRSLASVPLLIAVIIGAGLASMLLAPESIGGRLLLISLVGAVSLVGYVAILDAVDRSATAGVVGATISAAVIAFVMAANVGNAVSLAPVAWASAAAVAVLVVAPRRLHRGERRDRRDRRGRGVRA